MDKLLAAVYQGKVSRVSTEKLSSIQQLYLGGCTQARPANSRVSVDNLIFSPSLI